MAEKACWRCERADTPRTKVWIQTATMPKPGWREECAQGLACAADGLADTKKRLDEAFGVKS